MGSLHAITQTRRRSWTDLENYLSAILPVSPAEVFLGMNGTERMTVSEEFFCLHVRMCINLDYCTDERQFAFIYRFNRPGASLILKRP
jgi:hypothetical protein